MTVQEEFGQRVSNVVFMGMGEPMLNLGNVSAACRLLNQVMGIGARFLTISTVGELGKGCRLLRSGGSRRNGGCQGNGRSCLGRSFLLFHRVSVQASVRAQ